MPIMSFSARLIEWNQHSASIDYHHGQRQSPDNHCIIHNGLFLFLASILHARAGSFGFAATGARQAIGWHKLDFG